MIISIYILLWLLVGISIQNFVMNMVGPEEYRQAMRQKLSYIVLAILLWPMFVAVYTYCD